MVAAAGLLPVDIGNSWYGHVGRVWKIDGGYCGSGSSSCGSDAAWEWNGGFWRVGSVVDLFRRDNKCEGWAEHRVFFSLKES